MTQIDILEFVFRLFIYKIDAAAIVWGASALIISLFFVGLFWGKLWNKSWSLFGHLGNFFLSLICSLLLALTVIGYYQAHRALETLEGLRYNLSRELVDLGSSNRNILEDAWNKLAPLGGQGSLLPVPEGGEELRLNSRDDALILAETASDDVLRQLRTKPPFVLGLPLIARQGQDVAASTVDAVSPPVYPVTVGADNEWTSAAKSMQVSHAIDQAMNTIKRPAESLKTALMWFGSILLVLQILLTTLISFSDIKANPSV